MTARKARQKKGGIHRIFRYMFVLFGLLVFIAFFGTITLVFNPFESGFKDVTFAVPRDVHFFLRKAGLGRDFKDFPEPVGAEDLTRTVFFDKFMSSRLFNDLDRDLGLTKTIHDIRTILEQSPIDLFSNLAATDFAVAGKVIGSSWRNTSWCVYTKVGWKVKAILGLLKYRFTHKWLPPGFECDYQDGIYKVTASTGDTLWVAREKDLLMVSNDGKLLGQSYELAMGTSKLDPLGASADYQEGISKARVTEGLEGDKPKDLPGLDLDEQESIRLKVEKLEENTPLEFFFNTFKLFSNHPELTAWPDKNDPENIWERLASLFVQPSTWRRVMGILHFIRDPNTIYYSLQLDLDVSKATPFFARWLEIDPEENSRFLDKVARLAPSRAVALGAIRVPVIMFMKNLYDLLDSDTKELIQDSLRGTGRFYSVEQAIYTFFTGFYPRVGFIVRTNDYPPIGNDPETDGVPIPAVAFIFWCRAGETKRIQHFIEFIKKYNSQWGFTRTFRLPAGPKDSYEILEFHSPQISGTGSMAIMSKKEFEREETELFIANSARLVREMINVRFREGQDPLEASDSWRDFRFELPKFMSGYIYVNGYELADLIAKWKPILISQGTGERAFFDERMLPKVESGLLKEKYAGYSSRDSMPEGIREDFDKDVRKRLDDLWKKEVALRSKEMAPKIDEIIDLFKVFGGFDLHLVNKPRKMKLRGRVIFDFSD